MKTDSSPLAAIQAPGVAVDVWSWITPHRDLETELVPEWRVKYVDYKTGKKKVKAVSRALAKARASPTLTGTPRSIFHRTRLSLAVDSNPNTPRIPRTPRTPRTPGVRTRNYGTAQEIQSGETNTAAAASSGAGKKRVTLSPGTDALSPSATPEETNKTGNEATPKTEQRRRTPKAHFATPPTQAEEQKKPDDPSQTPGAASVASRASFLPLTLPDPALPDPSLPTTSSTDTSATQTNENSRVSSGTGLIQKEHGEGGAPGDSPAPTHRRIIHFDGSLIKRPERLRRNTVAPDMTPGGFSTRSKAFSTATSGTGGSERRDRPLIRRLWSETVHHRPRHGRRSAYSSANGSTSAVGSGEHNSLRDLDGKEAEFFKWLQGELDMVEQFYREKEEEAVERLEVLKAQLGRMRDLRSREVEKARQKKRKAAEEARKNQVIAMENGLPDDNVVGVSGTRPADVDFAHQPAVPGAITRSGTFPEGDPVAKKKPWYAPIERRLGIGTYRFGLNSEALTRMGPSGYDYEEDAEDSGDQESEGSDADQEDGSSAGDPNGQNSGITSGQASRELSPNYEPIQENTANKQVDTRRDYTRRARKDLKVPYDRAKRQLKLALQEFYRGLELLKSYALLNRTAFRKINKKYDKAVDARPTLLFFSEKVNDSAYFVQSGVLDQAMVAVEDLYARYFARGNRKVAVGKLRSRMRRVGEDDSGSTFRTGAALAAGLVLAVEGLTYAGDLVTRSDIDPVIQTQCSYLLQIYAGYFLSLLLFLGFIVDAGIWTHSKINYVFIFEFDTRHHLDWKQLAEIPSLLFFLFGLFMFLNFIPYTPTQWFIYWPVLLVGLTLIILFSPVPIIYHRSRIWWAVANFRLLLAGLFPVEFRDFFLGDMYCSLTYAMGNIEVFFCLYAHHWMDPPQCNSSHSRLLGFFSTLPGIWRALQCIRRYIDTRNAFPHLVNCGKYLCTILFYMTLSMLRINHTDANFIAFCFFATLNGIYTSIWDIFMDWSLGDGTAPHRGLRRELGYRNAYVYYLAMIIDPILRFNWVFYAIFASELQHSAILSFFVSLSEVFRRIMWTIFRVENEHCTNVGRFRASRDVTLPYSLPPNFQRKHSTISAAETRTASPVIPIAESQKQHQQNPSIAEVAVSSSLPGASSAIDIEAGTGTGAGNMRPAMTRRRTAGSTGTTTAVSHSPLHRGLQRVGTAISMAHAQDFERKRRPSAVSSGRGMVVPPGGDDRDLASGRVLEDSEDDDDEEEEIEDDDEDTVDVEQEMVEDELDMEALEEEEEEEEARNKERGKAIEGGKDRLGH